MRRLGVIVLAIGLVGFLFATRERRSYDTIEGTIKAAVSTEERKKRDTWETLRWISAGVAVFGAVLVAFPGKKT
jgi:predicted membrane-bound mannosyltransferase